MLALLPVAILAVFVACTFAPFLAMGHGRHVPALLSGQAALSVVLMGTAALCSDLGPITAFLLGPGCVICCLCLCVKRLLR